jgi:uncharacterized membrane protein
MYFLPISLALFLLFILLIPVLIAMAPAVAFAKLGLPPILGYAFFIFCLIGGGMNIPVYRKDVNEPVVLNEQSEMFRRFLGLQIPHMHERVIAINVGGAVLPGMLSLYIMSFVPFQQIIIPLAITTAVAYGLSRPVQGVGITIPAFVPPIVAAFAAILFAREYAPPVAYVSGVLGTLIGADLLRLPQIRRMGAPFLSIGGAGVFDGIYLVGLVAVLLA